MLLLEGYSCLLFVNKIGTHAAIKVVSKLGSGSLLEV